MLSILEGQIRAVLEDLSNEQTITFTQDEIQKYVKQFEEALTKQLTG